MRLTGATVFDGKTHSAALGSADPANEGNYEEVTLAVARRIMAVDPEAVERLLASVIDVTFSGYEDEE